MLRRAGFLTGVLVAAMATPAAAAPGDPPITPLDPADGASVAADPAGVVVRFTCPRYRNSTSATTTVGSERYRVRFGTPADVRADGTLAPPTSVNAYSARPVAGDPATCTGTLPAPAATRPGVVVWQAWRQCSGYCSEGWEPGPARRFTIRRPAPKLTVGVRGRAFGGFPAELAVRARDVRDGAEVAVERRAGGGWVTLGRATVRAGAARVIARLPAGRQRLRATTRLDGERFDGAPRRVTVRRPRRWSTSRRDDGVWTGTAAGAELRFRVAGGGRVVRGLRTEVPGVCVGPAPADNRAVVSLVLVRRVRIAPDGSILSVHRTRGTTITLRGRLARGRLVGGRAEIAYSTCSGGADLAARR